MRYFFLLLACFTTQLLYSQELADPLDHVYQWEEIILEDFYLDCTEYKTHIYDDFVDDGLDTTVWSTSLSGGKYGCPIDNSPIHHYEFIRWKNNTSKIGVYHPDNVEVSDGTVKLWSRKRDIVVHGVTYGHSLGILKTRLADRSKDSDGNPLPEPCVIKNSQENYLSFGKVSARVKMADNNGVAGAIWTWTPAGEIDLFDNGRKKYVEQCLFRHPKWRSCLKIKEHYYADDFHIYRVDYSPYRIEWSIDNVVTQTQYKYYDAENNPYTPICGQLNKGGKFKVNPLFPDKDNWYPLISWVYRIKNVKSDECMEIDWIIYERKSYQLPELLNKPKSKANKSCELSFSLKDGLLNFGHFEWERYSYRILDVTPRHSGVRITILDDETLCVNGDQKQGLGFNALDTLGKVRIINNETEDVFSLPLKLDSQDRP